MILVVISAVMFFTSIGQVRLWDRDEPRNAGCAAEMMERGDYVVPIFNDELRFQKPVMLYWLIISAYQVFGVNEFAARFWSALFGIGTVLCTYLIARRLFDSTTALLAGVILCSSPMFCVAARAATPDSTLIFFSTLAMLIYVWGVFKPPYSSAEALFSNMPRTSSCILLYAVLGLGVLTKGPVAFLIPTAIIGMFLLLVRLPNRTARIDSGITSRIMAAFMAIVRPIHPLHFLRTCMQMRLGIAVVVVLLVAAPWYVLCHFQTAGDFTRMFFLSENFGRATQAFENHSGGIWYYPVAMLAGFFPWSVFLVPVLLVVRHEFRSPARLPILFLACWVGVQVGLFSLASTKLPSYVTPCYPALAILTAFGLRQWATVKAIPSVPALKPVTHWFQTAYAVTSLAGIAICVGLLVAGKHFLGLQNDAAAFLAAIALAPIVGGIVAMLLLRKQLRVASLTAFSVAAVLFCVGFFGYATAQVDAVRNSDSVLSALRQTSEKESMIASYGCLESSWVYYSKHPVYELDLNPLDSNSPPAKMERRDWEPKPRIAPEVFASRFPNAMYITTKNRAQSLLSRLPSHYETCETAAYFLKQDQELVVLRPGGLKSAKKMRTALKDSKRSQY